MNTIHRYIFRIGSNPVARVIFAPNEAEAWAQINRHYANTWVELEWIDDERQCDTEGNLT